MKKWIGVVLTLAVVGMLIGVVIIPAIAQGGSEVEIPKSISYQGYLEDKTTGQPVDTPVDITFTLYTELNGGTPVWAEKHTGVNPNNGLFSVELGGNGSPMQANVLNSDRWLGVKMGSDAEMTPRQKIMSVAYALVAEQANMAAIANTAYTLSAPNGNPSDVVCVDSTGKVGIGTGSPTTSLEIGQVGPTTIEAISPTLAGTYNTSGYAKRVYVSGKYAYIADGTSGIQIIDISNPGSPTLEGTYDTPGTAREVCVSGKYAYVADWGSDLQIIDISDLSSPTFEGAYDTHDYTNGICVIGKYAYLADQNPGLQIIDISDPSSPTLQGTYDTPSTAYGVYVSGKYAYVADGTAGLQIIDISDPSSPTLEGAYNTPDSAVGVYVSGKYAYVADTYSGMQIIDISDPSSPTLEGTYDTPAFANGIYVSGKYAYVADGTSGLQIIDISDPSSPTLEGTYDTSGSANGVYVSGKYAYVADNLSGLQIIDIFGIDTPAISTGNIQTGDITITENADIANNLYVRNGVNVGPGGLYVDSGNGITTAGTITAIAFSGDGSRLTGVGILWLSGTSSNIYYNAGNVGVGTASPDEALSISGRLSVSNDPNSGDDVGNRDFNDDRYLQQTADDLATGKVTFYPDSGDTGIIMYNSTKIQFDSADTQIYANVDDPEDLYLKADQDILLMPDGNVGIGTTNPTVKLHIAGTACADGNVGIGTTSPAAKLHVSGEAYIEGNAGIGIVSPSSKLEVDGRIKDKTGFVMPVGTVLQYAGSTAPEGWLICNGTAVSRTIYDDLFAVIDTTYGVGNGSTTFNLPNLCGRIPVGLDSAQTEFDALGEVGGEKEHTLTVDEMPSHDHEHRYRDMEENATNASGDYYITDTGSGLSRNAINHEGGDQSHNNLQPYIVMYYIIKY